MVWADGCSHSKLVGQERPHRKKKKKIFEQKREYERHWVWLRVVKQNTKTLRQETILE